MNTAILSYVDMDQSKITDDSSVAILNEIKADMDTNAPAVLMAAAAQSTAAGDYDTALHYYEKYMEIDDKNPEVIYDMGMVYKSKGDTDNANQMFGQVIMNFRIRSLRRRRRRSGILETNKNDQETLQKKSCEVSFCLAGNNQIIEKERKNIWKIHLYTRRKVRHSSFICRRSLTTITAGIAV